MPLYPVVNLKTGEQKDIHMSVANYEQWRTENPDWDKDWSQGCAGLRTRDASAYNIDNLASGENYEDKNQSLAENSPEETKAGLESKMSSNNANVKSKLRIN
tara:strand:+ start:95 stop:400 length:306 start_codon:yes stop_codon:yes gene_type:complete